MPAKPKPTASTTAIIDRPDPCPPDFVQAAIDALPAEITKVIVVDYGVKHPAPELITQIEEMLETHTIASHSAGLLTSTKTRTNWAACHPPPKAMF